jgi:hypothetical protein
VHAPHFEMVKYFLEVFPHRLGYAGSADVLITRVNGNWRVVPPIAAWIPNLRVFRMLTNAGPGLPLFIGMATKHISVTKCRHGDWNLVTEPELDIRGAMGV